MMPENGLRTVKAASKSAIGHPSRLQATNLGSKTATRAAAHQGATCRVGCLWPLSCA